MTPPPPPPRPTTQHSQHVKSSGVAAMNHHNRAAIRAARSAPQMLLCDIANTTETSETALVQALRSLPPRGPCHHTTTEMTQHSTVGAQAAAFAHRTRQPPQVRAAAGSVFSEISEAATGTTAAWAGRHDAHALHTSIPRAVLVRRSTDTQIVVVNPSCPPLVATAIADSSHQNAAALAVLASACPHAVTNQTTETAASHPNWPTKTVEAFAADHRTAIRTAAATHPRLPPQLITHLATDPNHHVRAATAHNPRTPPQLITQSSHRPPPRRPNRRRHTSAHPTPTGHTTSHRPPPRRPNRRSNNQQPQHRHRQQSSHRPQPPRPRSSRPQHPHNPNPPKPPRQRPQHPGPSRRSRP